MHDPAPIGPEEDRAAHVQIQFTIDDPDRADGIIEQLLADRMVACGQRVGPVVSRYWWQDSLERAEEWLVLLKTRTALGPAVIQAVAEAHPYETPEVVAHPAVRRGIRVPGLDRRGHRSGRYHRADRGDGGAMSTDRGPRICLIGAGGMSFGPVMVLDAINTRRTRGATMVLHDVSAERLEVAVRFADRINGATTAPSPSRRPPTRRRPWPGPTSV